MYMKLHQWICFASIRYFIFWELPRIQNFLLRHFRKFLYLFVIFLIFSLRDIWKDFCFLRLRKRIFVLLFSDYSIFSKISLLWVMLMFSTCPRFFNVSFALRWTKTKLKISSIIARLFALKQYCHFEARSPYCEKGLLASSCLSVCLSLCLSVRPSVRSSVCMEQPVSHRKDFSEI
jgi:hypothetical protein